MLKFSGYPYLIRGQPRKIKGLTAEVEPIQTYKTFDLTLLRPKPVRPRRGLRGTPVFRRTNAQYQAMLEWCNDARTGMPLGIPRGAMCVQRFDDSLNSAIHITYRISLRSSSMREPRDPLLKVLIKLKFCTQTTGLIQEFGWTLAGARRSGDRRARRTKRSRQSNKVVLTTEGWRFGPETLTL
jgi:hypothetical protein